MCRCFRLLLNKIPAGIDVDLLTDGNVYFDIDFESLSRTIKVEELSDFDKLTGAAALGFLLPATKKNKVIMASLFGVNNLNYPASFLSVIAQQKSKTLPQNILAVRSKTAKGWEVNLVDDETFWKTQISTLLLNQIELGTFEYTNENLISNKAKVYYAEGNEKVWHPLAHYGTFNNGQVDFSSNRPFVNIYATLKQGFLQLGWIMRSDFFLTQFFRSLWTYILSENFSEIADAGQQVKMKASLTATTVVLFELPIIFDDETTPPNDDPGGNYDTITGQYVFPADEANADIELSFFGVLRNEALGARNGRVHFKMVQERAGSIFAEHIVTQQSIFGPSAIAFFENESFVFSAQPEDIFYIIVYGESWSAHSPFTPSFKYDENVTVDAGAVFTVTPVSRRIYLGDTIEVKNLIDESYTFEQLLKGVLHFGQLKIETDFVTKEVKFFPSQESKLATNETVSGYYRNVKNDITGQIVCGSEKVTESKIVQNRYLELSWKKSTDKYIEQENLEQDKPVYSRTIDFNKFGLNEATTKRANPFFEPTVLIPATEIQYENELPVMIPALWDNDEGEMSYKIKPRIVCGITYGTQYVSPGINRAFLANYGREETFAFAAMAYDGLINFGAEVVINLAFGYERKDLYETLWKSHLLSSVQGYDVEYLVRLYELENFNFREKFLFNYEGEPRVLTPIEISDLKECSELTTPVKFRRSIDLEKEPDLGQTTDCPSETEIDVIAGDECLELFLSGTAFNVLTDVLEWRRTEVVEDFVPYVAPLCGCDYYEYFDFEVSCQIIGGTTIRFTIDNPQNCDSNPIDELRIVHINTQLFLTVTSMTWDVPISTFVNIFGSQVEFQGIYNSPLGQLFRTIKVVYWGDEPSFACNLLEYQDTIDIQKLYYIFEVRRITTYDNGCDPDLVIKLVEK